MFQRSHRRASSLIRAMKRRKLTLLAASLLIAASSFGCRRQLCDPPPNETVNQFPALSKALNVEIYLDGTLSIQGFIVPGIASRYQQVLPLLESTVESGWKSSRVSFYKFGTAIQELPQRRYLEAQHQKFYLDSQINRETLIQNVIDQAAADRMTIIVTDLFQTDADVNLIVNKIKDKYIANNLAVGVLAIKSEFNGKIYDVGPNNYNFPYRSDNSNPATFRPFYLVAFGNLADVSNYFDEAFKNGLNAFPETRAVIFSRYVSEEVSSFAESAVTDISKLQDVSNLLPTDTKAEHLKQFRVLSDSTPLASFSARLSYKALRYVMPVASPELEAEVTAFKCEAPNEIKKGKAPQQLSKNEDATRAFAIKDARLNESTLDFKAEIVPAFLPGAGIYCFKSTLRPKGYKLPDWFTDWNMSSEQAETWRRNPKEFNGATTFNLEAFLRNLWATNLQVQRPKVAEFYCYVKKD